MFKVSLQIDVSRGECAGIVVTEYGGSTEPVPWPAPTNRQTSIRKTGMPTTKRHTTCQSSVGVRRWSSQVQPKDRAWSPSVTERTTQPTTGRRWPTPTQTKLQNVPNHGQPEIACGSHHDQCAPLHRPPVEASPEK